MHTLETFDQGKWKPILQSKKKELLEGIKQKIENSGAKCRII